MPILDHHNLRLEYGYFYDWESYFHSEIPDDRRAGGVGQELTVTTGPDFKERLYVETLGEECLYGEACACTHTRSRAKVWLPTRVARAGGSKVTPVIPTAMGPWIYLRRDLALALLDSDLTGYALQPVRILEEQGGDFEIPVVYALLSHPDPCTVPATIEPPEENRCPRCGLSPFVCAACGRWPPTCPRCGLDEDIVVFEDELTGPDDRRIGIRRKPLRTPVIDPLQWKGHDFFGTVMTHRALQFFLSRHTYPLIADPAPVDMSRADAEARERLQRALG